MDEMILRCFALRRCVDEPIAADCGFSRGLRLHRYRSDFCLYLEIEITNVRREHELRHIHFCPDPSVSRDAMPLPLGLDAHFNKYVGPLIAVQVRFT